MILIVVQTCVTQYKLYIHVNIAYVYVNCLVSLILSSTFIAIKSLLILKYIRYQIAKSYFKTMSLLILGNFYNPDFF